MDADKTNVIFRKFKKGGDILALFPDIHEGPGRVLSYQHIGQHGDADYGYCLSITTPTTPDEYITLLKELEQIGYNLEIRNRRNFRNLPRKFTKKGA